METLETIAKWPKDKTNRVIPEWGNKLYSKMV